MTQKSLFENPAHLASGMVPAIAAGGKTAKLSKAQKRFNKLVTGIAEMRSELARWREFVPLFQRRMIAEMEPLGLRLREKQRAMVHLLDRARDGPELTKRQRAKVDDIVLDLLSGMLQLGEDAELVHLYDKYSATSFADDRRAEMELARTMASSVFGVDIDDDLATESPDDLIEHIAKKLHSAQSDPPQDGGPARKKSAKTLAHEARLEAAAQGASQSVRAVFRQLASQLHPDRETDPRERERKTALMQRVNKAYADGDLMALLELQLRVEQIDAAALASVAEDRVGHYNRVLGEQLERLREEFDEITAPFVFGTADAPYLDLTPESAGRKLDADIDEIKSSLRDLQADLDSYQDIRVLKQSLTGYRLRQPDADGIDFLDEIFRDEPRRKRRQRS